MFDGKTVCVTGGCGFIGSHLVERLRNLGASVIVIDSLEQGHNLPVPDPKVQFHQFKLGIDGNDTLWYYLRGVDTVFHLAAQKHNQIEQDSVENLNVRGTEQLLDVAKPRGVKKIIFTSSLYAYGCMTGPPMEETELPMPTTEYGFSKLQCEHACHRISVLSNIPVVVLRLFFTYGPRYSAAYPSVITKNFARMMKGEYPVIHGDGLQVLDYSYVGDVVDDILLASQYDKFGVFNVGSGRPRNIQDLISNMQEIAGGPLGYLYAPADGTAGSYRVADMTKFHDQFGNLPRTPLGLGLRRTWDWMKSRA